MAWSGRTKEKKPSWGTVKMIGTALPPERGGQTFEDVYESTVSKSANCFNIMYVNQDNKTKAE